MNALHSPASCSCNYIKLFTLDNKLSICYLNWSAMFVVYMLTCSLTPNFIPLMQTNQHIIMIDNPYEMQPIMHCYNTTGNDHTTKVSKCHLFVQLTSQSSLISSLIPSTLDPSFDERISTGLRKNFTDHSVMAFDRLSISWDV